MSKAKKYISDCTRDCSNYTGRFEKENCKTIYHPWLTPDQARKAVEIAREEIYEWLRKVSFDDYKVADEESYRMGCPYDYIDAQGLINDLKQAMNDE